MNMYEDRLYIVRHRADGAVEVEHRYGALLIGSYIGYPNGRDCFKLFPQKHRLHREVRYAGKTVRLHDMWLELRQDPASAAAASRGRDEKTEARAKEKARREMRAKAEKEGPEQIKLF